ncbi:MAG: hypothetical protein JSW54_05105 [Fidelibacterota bacterium]|nr:MAG: hypothetical protein JSW54_05105 [Candidatus Neomarinimicrobiota bacterium]
MRVRSVESVNFGIGLRKAPGRPDEKETMMESGLDARVPDDAEDICPILIGRSIPHVRLSTSEGESINLHEVIHGRPTVLIFYRGGW